MTTYGTIPMSSSPGGTAGTNLQYISRAKERLAAGLSTRRPWNQMFDLNCFNLPASLSDAVPRIQTNTAYFSTNYAIAVLTILFVSLLWHPISLIVFIVTMAAWLFFYFLRDEPLVIFGRTVTDQTVLIALAVVTVVLLLFTDATINIVSALSVGIVVVLIHAALRRTDDLYLDEEAAGFLTAAAAVCVPPRSSS